MESWPGRPYPLGATFDGAGTNFAVFSEVAESITLCLLDEDGRELTLKLTERIGPIWHCYIPRIGPGQRYGFRVHGPFQPSQGLLCNPKKLLIDPYAKALTGGFEWNPAVFAHDLADVDRPSELDSSPYVPKSLVVSPFFDWGNDRPPDIAWQDTIIYELHVKGFTALHPDIPLPLRGTYAGVGHPAAIDSLKRLGITAVELLPVHHFLSEQNLVQHSLRNYWGYNSIGYLAPHADYATMPQAGSQVQEFKQMVRALHAADIEVILDVVYNHTAEGGPEGPTLCFRGLDNQAYYRLADNKREYIDFTGCGNSLNMRNPHVLQLIMDSLRYWVKEMHVDGFRFDLASALARELHAVDRLSAFFDLIQQDPILQHVKLIAEPWDLGEGGYQVGNFPPLWSEWNGRYRDTVRDFWRGQEQTIAEWASRFTGSSDLYHGSGRRPHASINFVTCHDGFTLRDLVSYNEKQNLENGERNRDGEKFNRSWNCGEEGETEDPLVNQLRAKQQRNFLATLFLSQGVPMLLAGDEQSRTQQGNNNAYCQDNEISWIDWLRRDEDLFTFTRFLIQLRKDHPVFRRRVFFRGNTVRDTALTDIGWFRPDGEGMTDHDWKVTFARSLGIFLNGEGIEGRDARGLLVRDCNFYIIVNASEDEVLFHLPEPLQHWSWRRILDTGKATPPIAPAAIKPGPWRISGRRLWLLKQIV